ncbi:MULTISPECIES: helix-turn-helix transcriptional regulator [Gordonia]|uniref:Transcriptional regulator n=2 Tax=Gordonia terrae TaxID=2055 RepID=A0A2I1R887_9ACTN|nr:MULTISPECIES: helix-turn-helix transcriptional regulator [Gordonia]ANY22588.1 XRE family transcriptional regulator [Gordonia terrae]AWO83325.1 transcriptional regulator [Gordonia terrae]MCG7634200.1 helix-turn-helix transcriptional regulator [Gordonia sp. McavH-238-E]PKZ65354.1 transcriptional regulator [Gordonia terrae]UPW10506.1 helix-turn-helix transcriptional regulator [Gordonia terrae]
MSPIRRGEKLPIYNRIGVLRAERRMSRAELAALVGINVQSVGALERGDNYPSLDLAFRICDVFDLPVEAVFSRREFGAMSAALYHRETSPKSPESPPVHTIHTDDTGGER